MEARLDSIEEKENLDQDDLSTVQDKVISLQNNVVFGRWPVNVHGKIYLNITFGNTIHYYLACVDDATDQFNFGLDFMRENNFKLDYK